MSRTVLGPDKGSFWWKVSSEADFDRLEFYIDDVRKARISGSVDWSKYGFAVDGGLHTLKWRYVKNGAVSSGLDCGWVDKVEFSSTVTLASAIDQPAWTVSSGGASNWGGQKEVYYYGGDAGQSGDIGNNEESWMRVTVTGPGTLSYWWKVSSELGNDHLEFWIDDVRRARISGSAGWNQRRFYLGSGAHLLNWRYVKNDMISVGLDCGWVDRVEFLPALTLPEAIDQPGWTVSTGGSKNWFGQRSVTYYDGDAAQSGSISHSQGSWLQTTVTGPGGGSFWWKVSSQAGKDYLEFYIDGALQTRISGLTAWAERSFNVGAGAHTLKWRYVKDGSGVAGLDCGWVDRVRFCRW